MGRKHSPGISFNSLANPLNLAKNLFLSVNKYIHSIGQMQDVAAHRHLSFQLGAAPFIPENMVVSHKEIYIGEKFEPFEKRVTQIGVFMRIFGLKLKLKQQIIYPVFKGKSATIM